MKNKGHFPKIAVAGFMLASTAALAACDSKPDFNPERTNFPTVGFEEHHKVDIPFAPHKVCPLFEPSGRHLVYDWWGPAQVMREPEGDSLEGLVTLSDYKGHEIYLMVTDHEPEEGTMRYLVLWDDFELQRIDISCTAGSRPGITEVIWQERNAGLHKNGVSMVTKFVEEGHLKGVVERYAENATEYLAGKSD